VAARGVGLVVAAHDLFWCLQAVVLSRDESAAMRRAVVAILEEYNTRLKTGDVDHVATSDSLADAIGPASQLDLCDCKKFVEGIALRVFFFNAALCGARSSSAATGSAVHVPAPSTVLPGEASRFM
jgi:hypothetical protein